MLFGNRFRSMTDYATNYCTSMRASNSLRANLDFFDSEPQNKMMSNHTLRRAAISIIIIFTHRLTSGSRSGLQNAVVIEEKNIYKMYYKRCLHACWGVDQHIL